MGGSVYDRISFVGRSMRTNLTGLQGEGIRMADVNSMFYKAIENENDDLLISFTRDILTDEELFDECSELVFAFVCYIACKLGCDYADALMGSMLREIGDEIVADNDFICRLYAFTHG